MRTAAGCLIVLLCSLLTTAAAAMAHDPLGRAQPRIDTTVKAGDGLSRVIAFRVRDIDSGNPIPLATVAAVARDGAGTSILGDVRRIQVELFRCTFSFPAPGRWSVDVRVGGDRVVPTSFSLDIDVGATATGKGGGGSSAGLVAAIAAPVVLAGGVAVLLVLRRRRGRLRA